MNIENLNENELNMIDKYVNEKRTKSSILYKTYLYIMIKLFEPEFNEKYKQYADNKFNNCFCDSTNDYARFDADFLPLLKTFSDNYVKR